jgi:competence protein ComEC
MPTTVHFLDVGQGNMVLIQTDNGKDILYDCKVTDSNEYEVLNYLESQIGYQGSIDVFVCSHREADHMGGVKQVHDSLPIQTVWDSGVTGGTTTSSDYLDYMDMRRRVGYRVVTRKTFFDYGSTRIRVMNSKNEDLPNDPNSQSIVLKVEQISGQNTKGSVMLTGDTSAVTWKNILSEYEDYDLQSSLLLGSHHGSLTFFDDPADEYYYTNHLQAINPAMTILSVGPNPHGHPESKAIELYEKYSSGSDKGNKVYRTDQKGNIKIELKDGGGWSLWTNCS